MYSNRRAGQAIILIALSIFFLFAVMGFAVDLGLAYTKRQQMQTAADAAAQGGAMYATTNVGTCNTANPCSTYTCANVTPATDSLQAACLYASQNGFSQGGNNSRQAVTVTGGIGTPSGTSGLTTNSYWVKASISETVPSLFLFAGVNQIKSVAADATAVVAIGGGTFNCIYALNSGNTPNAFNVKGTVMITTDCGIYVNSKSTSGFVKTGSGDISAATFKIAGSSYSQVGSGSRSPTPTLNSTQVSDPLASLAAPSVAGCDYTGWSNSSTSLSPGVYCGGIGITGSTIYTFAPGIYILRGGGFNVTGSGTLSGNGVFFYNTGDSTHPAGSLNFSGSSNMALTAPTTGTYRGILYFQDRTLASQPAASFTGSTTNSTGTFYAPKAALSFTGSTSAAYQAVIADTVSMVGSSNIKQDNTGFYTGLVRTRIGLVE